MKKAYLLLVLALLFTAPMIHAVNPQNTGVVAIQVENCSVEEYEKILDMFDGDDFGVEYACNLSGIFVFKVNSTSLTEPSDLRHYVMKKVTPIVGKVRVQVLKVYLDPETHSAGC